MRRPGRRLQPSSKWGDGHIIQPFIFVPSEQFHRMPGTLFALLEKALARVLQPRKRGRKPLRLPSLLCRVHSRSWRTHRAETGVPQLRQAYYHLGNGRWLRLCAGRHVVFRQRRNAENRRTDAFRQRVPTRIHEVRPDMPGHECHNGLLNNRLRLRPKRAQNTLPPLARHLLCSLRDNKRRWRRTPLRHATGSPSSASANRIVGRRAVRAGGLARRQGIGAGRGPGPADSV